MDTQQVMGMAMMAKTMQIETMGSSLIQKTLEKSAEIAQGPQAPQVKAASDNHVDVLA